MARIVVLLCGPPGAGKTTAARASGLDVYDRDDYPNEHTFAEAISDLRHNPEARAVVIRWAPRSRDRATTARIVDATHVRLITTDRADLAARIKRRGRADAKRTLAGLATWHNHHDRDDGVPPFAGWGSILGEPASRDW